MSPTAHSPSRAGAALGPACAVHLCPAAALRLVQLKRTMDYTGLQLDLKKDFLTRTISLQAESRKFCFLGWFMARPSLDVIQ